MPHSSSKRQHGFAVVEALLVVIILAMLGFVGWYVHHAKSNADQALNNATNSADGITSKTKTSSTAKPTTGTSLSSGTDNASLQSDLSSISGSQAQEGQDASTASSGINDSANEITVPTN